MKTNLLICFFFLNSILSLGQVKEIYLMDDLTEITKSEFEKEQNNLIFYQMRFDLDTLIVNVKAQRIKKGRISKTLLDSIRTELAISSNRNVPKDNIIVINYYHGMDTCNSTGNKSYVSDLYKTYLEKLKSLNDVNQFFMFKSREGINSYGRKLNWIEDSSGIIEKSFLPFQYPCGSYVLIDATGNYYLHKGEYYVLQILDLLKDHETFTDTE